MTPWRVSHSGSYGYRKAQSQLYHPICNRALWQTASDHTKFRSLLLLSKLPHIHYGFLAKFSFYLCTRSVPYSFFLASLNTQGSVPRTSRQSFWHQSHAPYPCGTEQGEPLMCPLSTGPGYYRQSSTNTGNKHYTAAWGNTSDPHSSSQSQLVFFHIVHVPAAALSETSYFSLVCRVIPYLIERLQQQIPMSQIL